jgi:hypothetical protein
VGTLDELRRQVLPGMWLHVELWQPCSLDLAAVKHLGGVLEMKADQPTTVRSLRIQVADEAVIPAVASEIFRQGGQLLRLQPEKISLEEIYFKLQGNGQQVGER